MDCRDVQTNLSPYYDGELVAKTREPLESHLGSCHACSRVLREFQRLSKMVSQISQPSPPAEIWQRIQHGLNQATFTASAEPRSRRWHSPATWWTLAALIVIALGLGIAFTQSDGTPHDDLAVYWENFDRDPVAAQEELVRQFRGRAITNEQAQHQVGYSPLEADQLPEGLLVQARYLLEMPCCRCVQTLCQREDGTVLAVFEHDKPASGWFQGRPQIQIRSAGVLCRVTDLKGCIAASWDFDQRTITVVGLKSSEELNKWGQALATVFPKSAHTRANSKPDHLGFRGDPQALTAWDWI